MVRPRPGRSDLAGSELSDDEELGCIFTLIAAVVVLAVVVSVVLAVAWATG